MQQQHRNGLIGGALALIGIILLINNFDWIKLDSEFMWGLGFAVIGAALIVRYKKVDHRVSLLIIGVSATLIGVIIMLSSFHAMPDDLLGTAFVWIIGAIFIALHFRNSRYWWAIIPGGVLFVIGTIVLIDNYDLLDGSYTPIIFFLGLSAVFWYLYFYRQDGKKFRWPIYPAAALSAMAVIGLLEKHVDNFWSMLIPLCLIGAGFILILRQRGGQNPAQKSDEKI
ncbi:hypothetical protein JW960_23275 [candidate division KSB1 bacterium]|nr:hypothetical protein [candidate division KSB1 bacterium]